MGPPPHKEGLFNEESCSPRKIRGRGRHNPASLAWANPTLNKCIRGAQGWRGRVAITEWTPIPIFFASGEDLMRKRQWERMCEFIYSHLHPIPHDPRRQGVPPTRERGQRPCPNRHPASHPSNLLHQKSPGGVASAIGC